MAYAAVASLSQTIHLILNYHQDSISPELKIPITSVHQNVIFLQSFLEDYPDEADNWEERMRDVTNEAEDIIEILVSNSLLDSTVGSSEPKSKKGKYEFRSDLNELERVAEEIEAIAKGVKERHRQTAGGFDDGLMEIVDRLCGGTRRREIIKRVSIHDLVQDFCERQAKLDSFFLRFTESPVAVGAIQLQRRVTVADIDNILENVYGSTIRTIICLDGNREGIPCSLQYFRLLRILDLSEAESIFFSEWEEFNNQIFEQFHLRYLAFTVYNRRLINIPKAISKLENLQTLIIRPRLQQARPLVELPVEIWRMRQLRHVVVHSCVLPTQEEEEEMFALENLQTLDEAVDLVCSRDNLEMIPNLKKLCIFYYTDSHLEVYQLYNLIYFQKLEVLKIQMRERYAFPPTLIRLSWSGLRGPPWEDTKSPAFPLTLKRLSLSGLRLPWRDMKIVGLLPHLQELQLRDEAFVGYIWETSEGEFSQLNFLLIDNSDLEHWITATTHFPVLNCLVLLDCRELRKVPNDIGRIPTLELIEVDELNASLLGSAKSIQEDQQSSGNHSLQVRAVPIPFERRRFTTFF